VEFGSSSELDRVVSARSPSPIRLAYAHRIVPGNRVHLSWGSCSPRNATTSGAPARPHGREAVREDEGRQAFVGAVLRVLAPLDGSGRARGVRHEPLRARRYTVAPRRFAALLHAARASLELPYRAFPSRGAVPALAGRCFLAGSHPTTASAACSSSSRSLSSSRQLFARSPPGGERRRMSRDDGFSRPLIGPPVSHSRVASRPAFSFTPGSPVSSRHARFEALLPPGVRSLFDLMPRPG